MKRPVLAEARRLRQQLRPDHFLIQQPLQQGQRTRKVADRTGFLKKFLPRARQFGECFVDWLRITLCVSQRQPLAGNFHQRVVGAHQAARSAARDRRHHRRGAATFRQRLNHRIKPVEFLAGGIVFQSRVFCMGAVGAGGMEGGERFKIERFQLDIGRRKSSRSTTPAQGPARAQCGRPQGAALRRAAGKTSLALRVICCKVSLVCRSSSRTRLERVRARLGCDQE